MKNLIMLALLMTMFTASAQFNVSQKPTTIVNYQVCFLDHEGYDGDFTKSYQVFFCVPENADVILYETSIRFREGGGSYTSLQNCEIDELIHDAKYGYWLMNIECG